MTTLCWHDPTNGNRLVQRRMCAAADAAAVYQDMAAAAEAFGCGQNAVRTCPGEGEAGCLCTALTHSYDHTLLNTFIQRARQNMNNSGVIVGRMQEGRITLAQFEAIVYNVRTAREALTEVIKHIPMKYLSEGFTDGRSIAQRNKEDNCSILES